MKRSIQITLLFLICCATSFFLKTCHYNREAVNTAYHIQDAYPIWHGQIFANGQTGRASWRDALPCAQPNFMPFTIESAMMFAYSSDVAEGRGVPEKDPRLAYLPEVPPYAQMNMLLEWVLGWSWRAWTVVFKPEQPKKAELRFQDNPAFARFAAVQVRLWTAFIPGLIFLWLVVMKTPLKYAFAGGMLHAVSAASIARATGQDIVRGDFCIPLILLCFVLAYSSFTKPSRCKLFFLFVSVFAAFAAWDLCQMIFTAWIIYELIRWLAGGRETVRRRNVWLMIVSAILLNALIVPFNVTYGLIMSPLVCILLPLLMLVLFAGNDVRLNSFMRRSAGFAACALILWGVYSLFIDNPEYRANYSHFSEAMKAKVKYSNRKPMDPALLSYDARMMWTPSMHSATWSICNGFFPSLGSVPGLHAISGPDALQSLWNRFPLTIGSYILLLLAAGLFTVTRKAVLRDLPRSLLPHLFTFGFIIGFVYIVRYHEFLIIFLSLAFALLTQELFHGLGSLHRKLFCRSLGTILGMWLVLLLVFEWFVAARCRQRSYATDPAQQETAVLLEWMRQDHCMRGRTVLTGFTVGPMLMAYCGTHIVLQPQFGMEPIRRPVEEYLRIMYHGTSEQLTGYCDRYGVDFIVFDLGATGSMHPNSERYIANAPVIAPGTPVALMAYRKDYMRRFYPVKPPRDYRVSAMKFRVFKYIPLSAIRQAEELLRDSKWLIMAKDMENAKDLVKKAIELDPCSAEGRNLYIRLFNSAPTPSLQDFCRAAQQEGKW